MNKHLEEIIETAISKLKPNQWSRIIRLNLPKAANNPYARIEFGDILDNGLYQTRSGYYTIYYDGSVIKSVSRT